MRPESRRDATGLAGYGCLLTLVTTGFGGGALLILFGIKGLVDAGQGQLESGAEARALVTSLEGSVALTGFGALALLVAFVAGVVLLKELGDDAARRQRGPIRGD